LYNAVGSGSLDTVGRIVETGGRVIVTEAAHQATPRSSAGSFVHEKRDTSKQDDIAPSLWDKEQPA
jgi:hypothetical protein